MTAIHRSPLTPPGWLEQQLAPYLDDSYPGFLHKRMMEPGKTAVIGPDGSLSYAQLHAAIDATAHRLIASHGIGQGDRIVLNMENSVAMVIGYMAVHRCGAIAVPINPKLVAREISFVLSDAEPALYLCDEDKTATARKLAPTLPVLDTRSLIGTDRENTVELPDIPPTAPATIFYTSGTTGAPKGVIHTHRTLISGAFQSASGWGYDFPHTALAVTPLFHMASHGWFYPLLAFNGTLVIDSFRTERCFELIERHRIEAFNAVPTMLLMMAASDLRREYDMSSIKCVCFGASPMPPEKLAAVQELFPHARFWHGMGQTESGGTISVLPPELAYSKNGSTGFPIPGCEVRIVDDTGLDVPVGLPGEVLARGPNIMIGYHNRPDATRETLADGWLHTGDVGYADPDGCITLVDRKKDMIIRGGENIYSVEIENLIMSHDGVTGCAIIGLPDALLGETVCAVVLPRHADNGTLISELTAVCTRDLAPFKVPQVWKIVDELPRTATGKIQKAALRDRLSLPVEACR